jgi:hypothetical protein
MMRARLAAIVFGFCVACAYEPGSFPDDEGSGSGSGSQGQNDGDFDGDGLTDLVDNCPALGNTDQRDHDDDGRGDICDGCPHLPDTGKDTDVDGVADACDPRPLHPGDRLAFFEGFYAPVAWYPVIGSNTWQNINGSIRQQQMGEAYQLVRDDSPNLTTVFVDARVRINAVSQNLTYRRGTGIVFGYADKSHYFFCGLATGTFGPEVHAGEIGIDWWGNPEYRFASSGFTGQMAGEWLTLQARTTANPSGGTVIDCMGHRGVDTATAKHDAERDPPGDIGMRTQGTDASFDYVFVVEVPAS